MRKLSPQQQDRNRVIDEAIQAIVSHNFPDISTAPADLLAESEKHSKIENAVAGAEAAKVTILSILLSLKED